MQFQRLRVVGFKSFVDPVEFRIEPGLTGVVGPNGCGKSNVLEALRWVMGANSAKAMRAQGMDDVIFAGSADRPPRNHAEVTLTIDNAERRAPAPFTAEAILEVSRRIDRGQGSTYRVNGKEVRARDVQLLFADASTGANSPALVRQGQISELIAAKPQNRRRILEEAGGVSGLHTRRHEAELRLRAAEANLARLDDIGRELETQLARLKREARQAEKYKKISAEIRALQSAVLHARWSDAKAAEDAARQELVEVEAAVAEAARAAAQATTEALKAAERLRPAREEDAVAAALLHRATLERDRLDMAARQAVETVARLEDEQRRLAEDIERAQAQADDAEVELDRLSAELAAVQAEAESLPDAAPQLEAALAEAEAARATADAELERRAGALASIEARARAETERRRDADGRRERAETALAHIQAQRDGLGAIDPAALAEAEAALSQATAGLDAARQAVEAAETARSQAQSAEAEARQTARQLDDRLGRLQTEARGLAQLLAGSRREHAPVIDQIRVTKGYELALAAALGDDLEAGLDEAAPSRWAGAEVPPAAWPEGVEPLAGYVEAPEALAARLAWCGVVEARAGTSLARDLPVGARLVTREGQLWRWDGLTTRADAPRPAAVRLAQRGRLADLEDEIDRLKPEVDQALSAQRAASDAARQAEQQAKTARQGPAEAERAVSIARQRHEALLRDRAAQEARAQALDEQLERARREVEAAVSESEAAKATETPSDSLDGLRQDLDAARAEAEAARQAVVQARLARDTHAQRRAAQAQQRQTLERDLEAWTRRRTEALARIGQLEAEAEAKAAALATARERPDEIARLQAGLVDTFAQAEARRAQAADVLAEAEAAVEQADRTARAAERAASESRERRAGLAAHLEAASQRRADAADVIREQAGLEPEQLGQKLVDEAIARPADATGAEALLFGLEREREALGPVNLRAEDEAVEYQDRLQGLRSERSDLTGAIARLRDGIDELNAEGRERLLGAFGQINENFQSLFQTLFGGGQAELKLVESDDPLEAGLEIYACPPGKRLSAMSLMSGGEQALTATALIFAVFLANPAPVCVLDEVDAPLDDANVDRFCRMLDAMRTRTDTRFIVITHNPVTMSRVDRLYGVTMPQRGVSQLVSVDLGQAEQLAAE